MRRAVGVLLILLVLNMGLASVNPVKAISNDPYEAFWEILDREAELVVEVESGNLSAAPQLVENSRLGAENAANISALIWQAKEDLESSGVKMYYTAEELREMAQNISQNGLPEETVQALKDQGWTDEQIQALEDYIAQNANEINEDFNMTAFLEEFSMAFIEVAFKYNHYEAWALEKWKWRKSIDIDSSVYKGERMINPILADEWVKFYQAYENGDIEGMNRHIKALKENAYQLIVSNEYQIGRDIIVTTSNGESIKIRRIKGLKLSPVLRVKGGGLIINLNTSALDWKDEYYWPGALESYRLMSNVESLVKAIRNGNSNPRVQSILNEKVAELKGSLIVHKRNSSTGPIKPPIKEPINPIKPPKPPITLPATTSEYETQDPLEQKALNVNDNEGILKITDVNVVVDVNRPGEVEYHVQISLKAENNAINNIQINVDDYTSGNSDGGSVSFLNSGETYTWESKRFEVAPTTDGKLTVTGKVEVTYTPSCGAVPLSKEGPEASSIPAGCDERTIVKEYSATVDLASSVDWDKVHLEVEASPSSITVGDSVTYKVIVKNENDAPLDGLEYSITIPYSPTNSRTYSGTVDVPKNGEKVLLEKTITYEDASTYTTHISIYWNGKSKSAQTSVTVSSGTLTITGVTILPPTITHGDRVSFDVSVKNPVSRSRAVAVKLFIDGQEKSSKSLTIGGGSTVSVTLTWTAQAGEHDYRIEVWEDGKLEVSRSGGIVVRNPSTSTCLSGVPLEGHLEVYPEWIEAGESVRVHITVTNLDPNCAQGPFNIELVDDSGAKWWPKKDTDYGDSMKGYEITNGVLKIYAGKTMSEWTDFNNIAQTTTLYLKVGDKTLASAKINVKQDGPVKASMECKPTVVPLDGSTTCTVYFELKSADTITLNLEEVDFGGKKVWPNGPSSVTVNEQTVTLAPTNIQEDLTITIDINEGFINYYLDYPLLNYEYKMTKYSYLVVAKISNGLKVSDVVQLSDPVDIQTFEDKARKAYGIFKTIKSVYEDIKSGITGILETLTVKGGKELAWILHYHTLLEDQETPNNNIIGG